MQSPADKKIKEIPTRLKKEVYGTDYFQKNQTEYRLVMPIRQWVKQNYLINVKLPNFLKKILLGTILNYLNLLEKITGQRLYLEYKNYSRPSLQPSVQKLINFLFKKKIVTGLYRARNLPDEPKTIHYYFKLNPIKGSSGRIYHLHGSCGGCAPNSTLALRRATAEAFERYSLALPQKNKLIYGSYQELKNQGAVNPFKFLPFSKRQLHQRKAIINSLPLAEETKLGWVEAGNLFDNQRYLIPAQLCYIFYSIENKEPLIRQTSSNGAAAGNTWSEATYAAFCEAIERDALLIYYLNKLSPPQIDLQTIQEPQIQEAIQTYRRYHLKLYLLDITTDINIPSFMALTLDETGQGPAVHIATKTDFNATQAIFEIIYDGARLRPQLRPRLTKKNFQKVNKIYPHIRTINDRLILWSQPKMTKEIEFLIRGPKKTMTVSITEQVTPSEKLNRLKHTLLKAGLNEAYWVDISAPEARANNLWIIMALVPELYPLYLDEEFKYLGVKRLYEVPVKLGYLQKPKKESEFNPVPHPMA